MHHPTLRFRQIHLDFHTSPAIEGIGSKFDKKLWQEALQIGHVDSITCFSKCHHGWSYHPTKAGRIHPHMKNNLLREQFDAAKEIDVNVPIYLSAGLDNAISQENPQWRRIDYTGKYAGWNASNLNAGFHLMCFNGPYLDYLCEQIREAAQMFPDADGIFLDIITPVPCCCNWCMDVMKKNDLDPTQDAGQAACAQLALDRYYRLATEAAQADRSDMPIFHNGGHIKRGNRKVLDYQSHLELESLPTGGWGYDHFPFSAGYCRLLPDHDVMGMTGKFHTTWGEFGGYKHPNALRYECATMLALGTKCSVGDQLHPQGQMDMTTYKNIGAAYAEVEQKEPWCVGAKNFADIGVLSAEAMVQSHGHGNSPKSDVGVGRLLLEGHFLFDVLDAEMDFSPYKMLILPDDIQVDDTLQAKIQAYLDQGGKLFLTGESGLHQDGSGFAFDIGATWEGESEYKPDYVLATDALQSDFLESPMVMYEQGQRIKATTGQSLGQVYDPYFNRDYKHFCSHQHTPYRTEASGYDGGVQNGSILYLAHPVFTLYAAYGAVIYKDYVINALKQLLGEATVTGNLPSTGRLTLTHQASENRTILHLLYANTVSRGGAISLSGGNAFVTKAIEIIEELMPLHDVKAQVKTEKPVTKVTLEPQGQAVDFEVVEGRVCVELDQFTCHQMVVLHHG